jgi:hypothetical protein
VSKNFEALRKVQLASRSRPRLASIRQESAQAAFVIRAKDCVDPLELETSANEGLSRHGTSRYLIWFLIGVLLMSVNFILLRHYTRGMGDNRQATGITSTGKVPGILSPGSIVEQSTSALAATFSFDRPGFVLQVAAMKHEDNAEALAETLRHSNFPASVVKRGADPFYRVAIGVYGDADSTVRVKDELERQGFKAILRRWTPE